MSAEKPPQCSFAVDIGTTKVICFSFTHLLCFSVFLAVLLTITAILGNSLILFALHRDKSLHPPSKLLLRCLTVTDLSVGVIEQPTAITLLLSVVNENWKLCRVAKYLT